jgi:hypothetical protein
MRSLFFALALGASAGALDILPMAVRKMQPRSLISAFLQCLVLGLVAAYVRTPLPQWAAGILAGFALALPVVILIAEKEPASVVPVLTTQALLGGLCGLASGALKLAG